RDLGGFQPPARAEEGGTAGRCAPQPHGHRGVAAEVPGPGGGVAGEDETWRGTDRSRQLKTWRSGPIAHIIDTTPTEHPRAILPRHHPCSLISPRGGVHVPSSRS